MNKLRVDEINGVFFLFFKIFKSEVEDQQVRKMIISFLRNKKKSTSFKTTKFREADDIKD